MPVRRVEIFNCFELQTLSLDALAQLNQFLLRPEFVRVAGQPPAALVAGGLVVARIFRAAFEVVHQMRDDVGRPRLPRELEIFARQHVPVKSESKVHGNNDALPGHC